MTTTRTIRDARNNDHSTADGRFVDKHHSPAEVSLLFVDHAQAVKTELDRARNVYRSVERQMNESAARGVALLARAHFPDAATVTITHSEIAPNHPYVNQILDFGGNELWNQMDDFLSHEEGGAVRPSELTNKLQEMTDNILNKYSAEEDIYEPGRNRGVILIERWLPGE
ncbi:hypothetical protein ACFVAJ_16915 [Agromyces sp. NPDC057679]|uniref:hypothetical protein n=1 Tax=Agromyces sp. NPDC057679 TaxID=3346207 RepID=UPI0036722B2A